MTVRLSSPPCSLASRASWAQASWAGAGLEDGRDAIVGEHARQPVGAEEQHVAGLEVRPVHLDLEPGGGAADDVGDDVAELVLARLGRRDEAALDHLLHQGVVARELEERAAAEQVAAAVAHVGHEEIGARLKAIVSVVPIPRRPGLLDAAA